MKDPTIGIGTNDLAEMTKEQLLELDKKLELWIEELHNRNWENDNWGIHLQIDNDLAYIGEMFKPALDAAIKAKGGND